MNSPDDDLRVDPAITTEYIAGLAAEHEKVWDYGLTQLEGALEAVLNHDADLDVLARLELALMAFALCYSDGQPSQIVLDPRDVIEYATEPEPQCTCRPGLVARGGFSSGCPVHAR